MQFLLKYLSIFIFLTYPVTSVGEAKSVITLGQEPRLSVVPEVTYPGDTILINSSQSRNIEFNGNLYKLEKGTDGYITFIPIPINQRPKEFEISLHPDESLSTYTDAFLLEPLKATVKVSQKNFSTQYLEINEELEEMNQNEERIAEDRKKFMKALSNPIHEPLMSGTFLKPLEGRTSTMFGYTRYINGELDSRHLAIDIAAPEGMPIVAPNHGVVVLAEPLYLSGNRVIIDHGAYLYSSFSHMTKLNVKVGDKVKKGEIIGWVGSTGFSTGPHLHHAMYVRGYAVNPEQFFSKDPYKW